MVLVSLVFFLYHSVACTIHFDECCPTTSTNYGLSFFDNMIRFYRRTCNPGHLLLETFELLEKMPILVRRYAVDREILAGSMDPYRAESGI